MGDWTAGPRSLFSNTFVIRGCAEQPCELHMPAIRWRTRATITIGTLLYDIRHRGRSGDALLSGGQLLATALEVKGWGMAYEVQLAAGRYLLRSTREAGFRYEVLRREVTVGRITYSDVWRPKVAVSMSDDALEPVEEIFFFWLVARSVAFATTAAPG